MHDNPPWCECSPCVLTQCQLYTGSFLSRALSSPNKTLPSSSQLHYPSPAQPSSAQKPSLGWPTAVPTAGCCRVLGAHPTATASLKGTAAPGGQRGLQPPHQPQGWGQSWHEETEDSISLCLLLFPQRDPYCPLLAAPLCPSLCRAQDSWPGGSPGSSCRTNKREACPNWCMQE